MSAKFPITEAQLVGLFCESITFGIYLATFPHCIQALFVNRTGSLKRSSDVNWPMVLVAATLLSIATLDICLGFYHNLKAFIFYTGPGGPTQEFTNISDWINVMKTVTVVLQTTIGDAVLIYRCWIVYEKSWLVVSLSILLWLGDTFCTIMIIVLESTLHSRVLINSARLTPYLTAFWALTISLNIITTTLLVSRIWKIDRQAARFGVGSNGTQHRHTLKHVIRVVIESGCIYTITAFVTFVAVIAGSIAVYPLTDMEVQIVGIAFNLILIRITRRSHDETMFDTRGTQRESISLPSRRNRIPTLTTTQDTHVHVVVTTDTDTDNHSQVAEDKRNDFSYGHSD
jgi:hypothetical protein